MLQPCHLKSNHCYAVLDGDANIHLGGKAGVYFHDTRHISEYRWDFGALTRLAGADQANWAFRHWGLFDVRTQRLSVARIFRLLPDGFEDDLLITNESLCDQEFAPSLTFDVDFRDIFEARGRTRDKIGRNDVERDVARFSYVTQDGVKCKTDFQFENFASGAPMILRPGDTRRVVVRGTFRSSRHRAQAAAPAAPWSVAASKTRRVLSGPERQAFDDIDMLMATTLYGPVVLTGVPNYVNIFGRDSLIASWFLLSAAPGIAESTLRILAAHQGKEDNLMNAEAPGKIAHELRDSELARTGDVPFGRYYATADASPLFVILMRDYCALNRQSSLGVELAKAWRSAIGWCRSARDDDGLLRYSTQRRGRGLINNSWKDSEDSMSHSDGRLAKGRLAVVEVQGYLAAAFDAAADLEEMLASDPVHILSLRREALASRELIERLFWNDDLGVHAMAIDEAGTQCDVVSSNPGHLLCAGVLSEARAADVADRLMQPDMWTGWGVRCLSAREKRYQPLSYHNGSVWPHDNGIIAAGAQRYGLKEPAERIWRGMIDAAAAFPGCRLPELFGGYDRVPGRPPIPYVESCFPQAWSAAALVYWATNEAPQTAG